MGTWSEHVLPHGELMPVGARTWQVTGSLPRGNMPRNMVVHRLNDGTLVLHSVVALNDETLNKLLALGKPAVMIVPNRLHRLDAEVYKKRFPDLKVVAPSGARKYVEEKVRVDATAEEYLPTVGVTCLAPAGIRPFELIYEFADDTGKVWAVTDVLMNMKDRPGVEGWIFKKLGSTGFFGITLIGRLLLMSDRGKFKTWLEQQSRRRDLIAICPGHGEALVQNCAEKLAAAAARL